MSGGGERTDAPRPVPGASREAAERLAHQLREAAGGSVSAVLLYGSHLLRTNPDRHSAVDLVVVVDDYRRFYESVAAAGALHRPPWLMTLLARFLAPNVIAFAPDDGREGIAKYLLVDRAHLERALGPERRDHFLLARLVQRVGVLWTRDEAARAWIADRISEAHAAVLEWLTPYLDAPLDVEGVALRMIEVCYAAELRPESRGRAEAVFGAQRDHLREVLQPVLDAAVAAGSFEVSGGRYRPASPVAPAVRRRVRRYFRRSKSRATARWFKHIVTFANWLPYVVRKVERHTGRRVELTTLERRVPLLFLWPRVAVVLLTRPRNEIEP